MKVKEKSEKVGLELHIHKTKIMASGPISLWQIDGETVETVADFIFQGSQITADGDCSHDIKRHLQMYRCTEQTFGLCGRRRGWDVLREQHVYYLKWNRSPAQVGCMRQVLRPGALGRPRVIGWRGRCEGGSGWGIHVTPWLIHVNVWQNPLKCCELISLQLIKINEKKKKV